MYFLINHLEKSIVKACSVNRLSKYLLIKELITKDEVIQQLMAKFN